MCLDTSWAWIKQVKSGSGRQAHDPNRIRPVQSNYWSTNVCKMLNTCFTPAPVLTGQPQHLSTAAPHQPHAAFHQSSTCLLLLLFGMGEQQEPWLHLVDEEAKSSSDAGTATGQTGGRNTGQGNTDMRPRPTFADNSARCQRDAEQMRVVEVPNVYCSCSGMCMSADLIMICWLMRASSEL